MVVFVAFRVLTFDGCSTFIFLAHKALAFESFMIYVFDTFDADHAVFFLKVALWDPDSADIVDPDIVACRNCRRIG